MNRPFANTAASDYDATAAAVELQLVKLKLKLEAHKAKAKAKADPKNWCYSYDLRKVESDLAKLLAFLN